MFPRHHRPLRRNARRAVAALALFPVLCTGCTWISYLGTDPVGADFGKTFYVGGAGPFGHVGTLDVPNGLREGGYQGATEAFGWQGLIPLTIRDQMDRERNHKQARRLGGRIREYVEDHPGKPVNIIALSGGTGIAAWALEALPERTHVHTVVFLSSSLSRRYDLTEALRRVDGAVYNFYSTSDPVLRYGVPIAGSIDREFDGPSVAGLLGFTLPPDADDATMRLYVQRVRNMPWRRRYSAYGYSGGHIDATNQTFVARILTPLLAQAVPPLDVDLLSAPGDDARQYPATTQPLPPPLPEYEGR